jgi:hypothetical protein
LGVGSPRFECSFALLALVFDHFRLPQQCQREATRLTKARHVFSRTRRDLKL